DQQVALGIRFGDTRVPRQHDTVDERALEIAQPLCAGPTGIVAEQGGPHTTRAQDRHGRTERVGIAPRPDQDATDIEYESSHHDTTVCPGRPARAAEPGRVEPARRPALWPQVRGSSAPQPPRRHGVSRADATVTVSAVPIRHAFRESSCRITPGATCAASPTSNLRSRRPVIVPAATSRAGPRRTTDA